MKDLIVASDRIGDVLVVSKSGKLYNVERDVITANAKADDPLIYGWPERPHIRRRGNSPTWFRLRNLRLAEPDDQHNI